MPSPVVKNIKIYGGADFALSFTYLNGPPTASPVNLSGYSADLIVKDVPKGVVLWTLSTGNGGVSLGGSSGVIVLQADSTVVDALLWTTGIYEFCITSPTDQRDLLMRGHIGIALF